MAASDRRLEAWSRLASGSSSSPADFEKSAFLLTGLMAGGAKLLPHMAKALPKLRAGLAAGAAGGAAVGKYLLPRAARGTAEVGKQAVPQGISAYKSVPDAMDKVVPSWVASGRKGARVGNSAPNMVAKQKPRIEPAPKRKQPRIEAPVVPSEPMIVTRPAIPNYYTQSSRMFGPNMQGG